MPVGAIRVSVGMANVEADVTRVIGLLKEVRESLAGGAGVEMDAAALAA